MRTKEEFLKRIRAYGFRYLYEDGIGYLAWGMGTGDNIEFLFLEVANKGQGLARGLYKEAVKHIADETPPFHSCYTFTQSSNEAACRFYEKFGWTRVEVGPGLFRTGDAVMFHIPFRTLKETLGVI